MVYMPRISRKCPEYTKYKLAQFQFILARKKEQIDVENEEMKKFSLKMIRKFMYAETNKGSIIAASNLNQSRDR